MKHEALNNNTAFRGWHIASYANLKYGSALTLCRRCFKVANPPRWLFCHARTLCFSFVVSFELSTSVFYFCEVFMKRLTISNSKVRDDVPFYGLQVVFIDERRILLYFH